MSSANLKRNVFLFLPCQSFPPPLFLFYKSFSVYTGVRLMETSVPQSATLPLWKYTSMFSKSTCKNVIPYANECTSHPHFHFYFILFFLQDVFRTDTSPRGERTHFNSCVFSQFRVKDRGKCICSAHEGKRNRNLQKQEVDYVYKLVWNRRYEKKRK